jgi:RNA polymerase sigma-70 factor (ECF subfamily)
MQEKEQATLELVGRAKAGDAAAWNRLYGMYKDDLERRIRARMGRDLRGRVDEADVMQTVWGEAIGSLERFEYRGQGSFLAWISAIVRHKIARKAGEEGRRGRQVAGTAGLGILGAAQADEPGISTAAQDNERLELLRRALRGLTDGEREVLQLSFFAGLKHREVGEQLGISEDAARLRVSRAEAALARALAALGGDQA